MFFLNGSENILSGFVKAGIWPINRSIIPASEFSPSLVTDRLEIANASTGNAGSTKDFILNSNINLAIRSSVETFCDKPSTSGDANTIGKEILIPSVTRSEMFFWYYPAIS
ncbi:hypothetical protein OUZ56_012781 [Daphnia magna]|uniref:Uncharacterized protein n=1 Tax=Daphnia magna TaxID=35525 RepID=A0ABQ9Z421_9CRUS|nr:hypothetical protein OUZ56_012781 [Daphnia magna]